MLKSKFVSIICFGMSLRSIPFESRMTISISMKIRQVPKFLGSFLTKLDRHQFIWLIHLQQLPCLHNNLYRYTSICCSGYRLYCVNDFDLNSSGLQENVIARECQGASCCKHGLAACCHSNATYSCQALSSFKFLAIYYQIHALLSTSRQHAGQVPQRNHQD